MSKMIEPLSWDMIPPEFISSLLAMAIVMILAIAVAIGLRRYDPLKRPKGFMHLAEIAVSFADKEVKELMGPAFDGFGGYILALALYIMIGFIIGMIGIPNFLHPGTSAYLDPMPNPFTNTAMPLSIALATFFWIHFTAAKSNHWAYFKRYIQPMPFFLPINLITMWSPVLSLTLRLFGNALAGYFVMTLIYVGFSGIIPGTMAGLAISPVIASLGHLYFDLFDGFIQLTVFCMLTMINVSSEYVSPEMKLKAKEDKAEAKRLKAEKRAAKKLKRQKALKA